ncbi:unnamed protein product, partial [Prorocentrum cordatum]
PCRNVPGRLRRSLGEGLGDGSESGGASEPSQEAPAFSLPPPGSPPNQGWATSAPQPAPAPEGIPRLPSRRLPTGAALRYARSSSPSRRVEKAITKNPAPSAATTKSARSTCLCTVGNSQLQHTCAPQVVRVASPWVEGT